MKTRIVDAGVAAKWFLPEDGAGAAVHLLCGEFRLLAPDLIWPEFTNILWKNVQRRTIEADDAEVMLEQFLALPLDVHASMAYTALALQLAIQTNRTAYDCIYLALTLNENGIFVTADQRFINSLTGTDFATKVMHVSQVTRS